MNIIKGILLGIFTFLLVITMTALSILWTVVSWVLMVIGFPILIAIAYITKDK